MWKKDQIKLLLPQRRYSCLDTVVVTTYYLTIVATVIVGIQLLIIATGIKFHTILDLRILEPYLSTDSNILFVVSVLIILSSTLGILSALQVSRIGIITSIALLVMIVGFTDVYVISNYRTTDYLSPSNLYQVLLDSMTKNPLGNIEFHLMQQRLACCGINDYTDWLYTIKAIPGSCCDNSTICDINDPSLNKDGCLNIIRSTLSNIYQNTIDVLVALNVVGVTAIFTGYFYSYLLRQLIKGDKILRTTIPRIQMSNAARGQQTGQIFNLRNNRSSIQVINDNVPPTAPTPTYPNLYNLDSTPNP